MAEIENSDVDVFLNAGKYTKPSTRRAVEIADPVVLRVPNTMRYPGLAQEPTARWSSEDLPTSADIQNTVVDDYEAVRPNLDLFGRDNSLTPL
jgi:hypothetical protein